MSSVRKKRNFKDLHLPSTTLSTPAPNTASTADGKSDGKSTAPTLKSGVTAGTQGSKSGSSNGIQTAQSTSSKLASTSVDTESGADYHDRLSEKLANFGLGYKLVLKNEDLKFLSELGSGNGGTVTKVLHTKSDTIMAKKVVLIDAKTEVRKQILRELQILHECNSPHIVSFYGAFLAEPHICMCMEYMDVGSLDSIYKKNGPIKPDICGQVIIAVVRGLTYLYANHKIIHRDVKPSNILVNGEGRIKIIDFGVSGELINSIADTFVGTSTYMSPERIKGDQYSVKSDVWSLGVSIIELALGRFPFAENDDEEDEEVPEELQGTLSPAKPGGGLANKQRKGDRSAESNGGGFSMFDLLQRIVNEPPLALPRGDGRFSEEFCDFIDLCLRKDLSARPSPKELSNNTYFKKIEAQKVDLLDWVKGLKK
ncbi:hypothetical protein L7F22_052677 [Adiantum nelumboides]|nr:hypothetical protein [Adiantum nelumboides]